MHVTLRQLEIFEAVVRNGGVTTAARELHCTQPTVSIQLKQLAEQVGLPLFERGGRNHRLTAAGEALYQACLLMSHAWSDFEARIDDLKGLRKGRLRLGVVSTAQYLIPRLLGPFCKSYPGVDVSIEVANRQRIVERLKEGLDDLTFMSRPPEEMALNVRPFVDNPLVLIVPESHTFTHKKRVRLNELGSERMLLREAGSGTRMAIDEFFANARMKLSVRMEIGSNEAIKQAVAGGLGISIISRHALREAAGVVEVDCEGLPIHSTWKIVSLADRPLSLIGQRFVDYLLDEGMKLLAH
ncbi:MAG: LysR family transcriptional regulator [Methylophilaceae bacterium]|nr:LysR family transcriptional regulator [Methylophilaceae bacterium]